MLLMYQTFRKQNVDNKNFYCRHSVLSYWVEAI